MASKDRKKPQESQEEPVPQDSPIDHSTTPSPAYDATSQKPKRTVEVDFSELENGTIVEMIENPNDATKSLLAIWNNGQVRYAEKLKHGDQVLVAAPRDTGIIRRVRLATGAEPYESVQVLLEDIVCFLHYTLELSPTQLLLLSSLAMSTWVVEKLPVAPYVAFVGPPGSGKTTALRILSLLCRRSLLTSDISSAGFYELCDRMTTTVLIDETATVSNRRELFHLLRNGSSQDFVAVRKGGTFKSFGSRAVSWTELPDDAALNSRCLLIPMSICKRTNLLAPTDPRVLREAGKLQRKLLQFRFTNYNNLTLLEISGERELQPRTRDLFRALALPLSEHRETCEMLLAALKPQESLRDVLSVYQSTALDLLYSSIHSCPGANGFRIMELTQDFNANLRQRGESGHLSEKKFSNILTSLKLTNRTRTNSGYVLWLNLETREQIHSLARTYGVTSGPTNQMLERCELCQKVSERTTAGSTTTPIVERKRTNANGPCERRERREHRKRRIKRKATRAIPAASSRRR